MSSKTILSCDFCHKQVEPDGIAGAWSNKAISSKMFTLSAPTPSQPGHRKYFDFCSLDCLTKWVNFQSVQ